MINRNFQKTKFKHILNSILQTAITYLLPGLACHFDIVVSIILLIQILRLLRR